MNKIMVSTVPILLLAVVGAVEYQTDYAVAKRIIMNQPKNFTARHAILTPYAKERISQQGELYSSAMNFLNEGRYAAAEAKARQALALGSPLGQEVLAAALYAQGKDQEAFQVYKAIADRGANAARNEYPYALLLLKSGHWAKAVEAYNTALTLGGDVDALQANSHFSPNVPQPAALEAAIRIGMGVTADGGGFYGTYQQRREQALAQFQKALALEPNNPLVHYYYGYGLTKAGQRAQAHTEFQKAADTGNASVKKAAKQAMAW
jgi:tetratricopeptide (TPR) repeat protein